MRSRMGVPPERTKVYSRAFLTISCRCATALERSSILGRAHPRRMGRGGAGSQAVDQFGTFRGRPFPAADTCLTLAYSIRFTQVRLHLRSEAGYCASGVRSRASVVNPREVVLRCPKTCSSARLEVPRDSSSQIPSPCASEYLWRGVTPDDHDEETPGRDLVRSGVVGVCTGS